MFLICKLFNLIHYKSAAIDSLFKSKGKLNKENSMDSTQAAFLWNTCQKQLEAQSNHTYAITDSVMRFTHGTYPIVLEESKEFDLKTSQVYLSEVLSAEDGTVEDFLAGAYENNTNCYREKLNDFSNSIQEKASPLKLVSLVLDLLVMTKQMLKVSPKFKHVELGVDFILPASIVSCTLLNEEARAKLSALASHIVQYIDDYMNLQPQQKEKQDHLLKSNDGSPKYILMLFVSAVQYISHKQVPSWPDLNPMGDLRDIIDSDTG